MGGRTLSDRSRRILAALVLEHIETGQPVSSHALVDRVGFGVSSATVRNILAQLEEHGYLHQPHTSAGRVPTDLGYRAYVDLLLEHRRRPRGGSSLEAELRARAGAAPLMDEALATVSRVISSASHHIGFVVAPMRGAAAFHQIDFVPLAGSKILVVVVARGGRVINKVVDIGEILDVVALRQAANYVNTEFAGLTLAEARAQVAASLAEERTLYDALLARALRLAQSAFDADEPGHALFVEGTSSLLEALVPGPAGPSLLTLGALLRLIEEKHRLVRLLTEYMEGPGLTVVIGTEHAAADLWNFSLVASTYGAGERAGSVGVIGPTRMRYARTIAVVDNVARAVSHLLAEGEWDATSARG